MSRIFAVAGLVLFAACDAPSNGQSAAGESCHPLTATKMLPADLDESSGVAFSETIPGLLWTHNDSGGEPELFALDLNGALVGRVRVTGATNRDWEDIARGPCPEGSCIFIGDIGDNAADRDHITIYVVPEPRAGVGSTAVARRYRVRYPDGPRDAEALFVTDDGEIFIVGKGGDAPIHVYRYPLPLVEDSLVELQPVRALSAAAVPLTDRVTAADARNGRVVMRTYTTLLAYRTSDLIGSDAADPARFDLTPLAEGQGEGLAIGPNGMIAITGEGFADQVPGSFALLRCPFLDPSEEHADPTP